MDQIELLYAERSEGLRLLRELRVAEEALNLKRREYEMYVQQLGALHQAPEGWVLRDWLIGFVPPQAEPAHTH